MITENQPAPYPYPPARDGEPCPACGAPLAGDQRYCLHCGGRRPEARLEFLDVLDADVRTRGGGPVAAPPLVVQANGAPPPHGLNGRLQANAGLLALAALLLLTLLIGLLLGHWATSDQSAPAAATPAPQVIKVEGAAAPAAAAATTGTGSGGDTSGSSSKATKKAAKGKADTASDKATAPKDSVSVKSLSSKKAVDDAVKNGKPISTGTGKLPPKDDKPAGGGAGFEEIG
ncbi:hypothetical protein DSM104299_02269 [Baekduia alba]|nr:hypothetical protein DSM104299_02269 [Baekduia alba]